MRELRSKKFEAIVQFRKKIDEVKMDRLKAEFERKYKKPSGIGVEVQ